MDAGNDISSTSRTISGAVSALTIHEAAETTGKVLLVLSILMILGLGASVAGAVVSVRRERREHVVLPRAQTSVRPVTP